MNLVEREGVGFFTSDLLAPVVHGFSTRGGGVSKGPYASLNLWPESEDSAANVWTNRERYAAALGIRPPHLATAEQVHGSSVVQVTGPFEDRTFAADGLVTNRPGVVLAVGTADCVPILLWDPEHRAVGAVHAGWAGTRDGIAGVAVRRMAEIFDSRPDRILAAIGPAAGPCCYEVREDVAQHFSEEFLRSLPGGLIHLDLPAANRAGLLQAGLPESNIDLSGLCTLCRPDLFFSHRRDNGVTGGMLAVIALSTP